MWTFTRGYGSFPITTKPSTSWFHSDVWVIGEATHQWPVPWDPTPLAKQHLSEGVEAKRMESEGLRIPSAKKVPQVLVNQIWYQVDLFFFFPHQVDWPKAFIFSLSLDEFQELGELTQHFKSLHYASSTIAAASWFMFLGALSLFSSWSDSQVYGTVFVLTTTFGFFEESRSQGIWTEFRGMFTLRAWLVDKDMLRSVFFKC